MNLLFETYDSAASHWQNVRCRYHFNGKETDEETGLQDYGMRMYHVLLGRFFRTDPVADYYPELSPYQFAGNDVIRHIDLDGLEAAAPTATIQRLNQLSTDLNVMANYMWDHSFYHNKTVVREWSADIVTRQVPLKQPFGYTYYWTYNHFEHIQQGDADSSPSNNLPPPAGDTKIGDFHTHPYSVDEGYNLGVPFSDGDINDMRGREQGYISMVESGTRRYALVVEDKAKADAFFASNDQTALTDMYNKAMNEQLNNGQTLEYACKFATATVLQNTGINFYQTNDLGKVSFEQVTTESVKKEENVVDETPDTEE